MSKRKKNDNTLFICVNGKNVPVKNQAVEYTLVEVVSLNGLMESGADFIDDCDSIEDAASHAMMVDKLHHALKSLTPKEQQLINWLYFSNDGQGMSGKSYSATTGTPYRTVKYQRQRVLAKLLQLLQGNSKR